MALPEKMNWLDLLSAARWGHGAGTPRNADGDIRNEFDRDYGRILYSSAFRRLQDKTQVVPVGRDDRVRTRLTHSLEVAYIGRSIGYGVGEALVARSPELRERDIRPSHFASVVSAACLAHDIGNPPFGHFGESALESALEKAKARGDVPANFSKKFEGNAQGFRVLTRTGDPMAGKGLKLTAAVLGAFMKYPCSENFSATNPSEISAKKFGFVTADAEAARFVADATGLLPRGNDENLAWCRHPLAFLMEAADDLSYLVADMEDAFVSKIISRDEFREHLDGFLSDDERSRADSIATREGDESAAHYVRAVAIGAGIRETRRVFLERENALLAGTQNRSILDDPACAFSAATKKLKAFSAERIYNEKVDIELMGFRVIEELFEFFSEWISRPDSPRGEKIARMLDSAALAGTSPEARTQRLLDFISSMTDSAALAAYRKLFGIR